MINFLRGQSSTGNLALLLADVALACFFLWDYVGLGAELCLRVTCGGSTLLAFILAAFAHRERSGRLQSAQAALVIATGLIVYFAVTRVF